MEQGNLIFQVKSEEIADEIIARCKDLRCALRMCIDVSGIAPKEIAFRMDIDAGHFSRMTNAGDDPRHFPLERINELMIICGNEIPLRWMALSRGYGLYRLKTELELEIESLRGCLSEAVREKEMMLKLIKELRT